MLKRNFYISFMDRFIRIWWQRPLTIFAFLLLPFAFIFRVVILVRNFLYRTKIFKITRFPVPIIIVGNITVGGSGKTPFVIWLAQFLQRQGFKPGIVSRGYGSNSADNTRSVTKERAVEEVGDEPLMIVRHTNCPMVIGADRVRAVKQLLEQSDCDIVISDDGLQHLALGRDIEIAMIDGLRYFGNGLCLPAGPLREPVTRLNYVDFIIYNEGKILLGNNEFSMQLKADKLVQVKDNAKTMDIAELKNQNVYAIAGIGHPERFFNLLQTRGLSIIEYSFPDHYAYKPEDIDFGSDGVVLMTEKDAVKCEKFANETHWFLPVTAELEQQFQQALLESINLVKQNKPISKGIK